MAQPTPGVSPFLLFSNAIGTMIGAGMYSTVGEVCKLSGSASWFAFFLGGMSVLLTALSMASLISSYPQAGAIANFTTRAFRSQFGTFLAFCLGIFSVIETLLALSATAVGFGHASSSFLPNMLSGPTSVSIAFVLFLWFVNIKGLKTSSYVSLFGTIVEVGGLFMVILAGIKSYFGESRIIPFEYPDTITTGTAKLFAILGSIHLSTFAFGGIQGVLDLAEESRNPRVHIPRVIILATIFTTFLYTAVVLSAVIVIPHQQFAKGTASLVHVVTQQFPWIPHRLYALIIVFAIGNTTNGIYQTVTRILYGLSRQQLIPIQALTLQERGTPIVAVHVVCVFSCCIILVFQQLHFLVEATSNFILILFVACNMSLLKLYKDVHRNGSTFQVPWIVPCLGLVCNLVILVAELYDSVWKFGGTWIGMIGVVYLLWVALPRPL